MSGKGVVYDDGSSTDAEQTPVKTDEIPRSAKRSSERIKEKGTKEFHMPSRRDVFDKIEDIPTSSKSYSYLKPRKLVNNFSRETHRYNYEANETTDESLEEDFIVDDEHFYEMEDREKEERRQRRIEKERKKLMRRIQRENRRSKTVKEESDSDDVITPSKSQRVKHIEDSSESDGNAPDSPGKRSSSDSSPTKTVPRVTFQSSARIESSDSESPEPCASKCPGESEKENIKSHVKSDSQESDGPTPNRRRKRKNSSIVIHSSDSDSSDVNPIKKTFKKKQVQLEENDGSSSISSDTSTELASPSVRTKTLDDRKEERRQRLDILRKNREKRLKRTLDLCR